MCTPDKISTWRPLLTVSYTHLDVYKRQPITDSKSDLEDKKSKLHTKSNKNEPFKKPAKNTAEQDLVKSQSILNAAEHDKSTYSVGENGDIYNLDLMKDDHSSLNNGQKKVSNNSYNVDELCERTTLPDKTCPTFVTTTQTPTTCLTTKHHKPHMKTTCCKTTVMLNVGTDSTTEAHVTAVSYTHLDVYKRQTYTIIHLLFYF